METVPAASRDRLSDLPDCLLHSVLSSLRSRQAVQTCLLSRRWRHLWRSVPCLDVDHRDFPLDDESKLPADDAPAADWHAYNKAHEEILAKRRRRFEDFADAVLAVNGVFPLDAFRLHVADQDLGMDMHRWLRRGLARHPAELLVAHDGVSYQELLFSLDFASGGAGALSVTSRLTRLHLSGLTLSQKFAEELGSECLVLEELKLVECEYHHNFNGRIASSSLKRLHIQGFDGSYNSSWSLRTLDVPALVYLNVDNIDLPDIEHELESLAVASITYPVDRLDYGLDYSFLKSMHNARVLKLQSFTMMGLLQEEHEHFREFHNLRTLILKECHIGQRCQVLRYVLENVSNLERLVLQDCRVMHL